MTIDELLYILTRWVNFLAPILLIAAYMGLLSAVIPTLRDLWQRRLKIPSVNTLFISCGLLVVYPLIFFQGTILSADISTILGDWHVGSLFSVGYAVGGTVFVLVGALPLFLVRYLFKRSALCIDGLSSLRISIARYSAVTIFICVAIWTAVGYFQEPLS